MQVDFDALWKQAFWPVLTDLGYMPIRADVQTGSVIIKDMLEQLVHADLVLVDLSLPNANVYYEAGVRHEVKEKGCVLVKANWARSVFDLAQITTTSYPFPTGEVKAADYEAIREVLRKAIPSLSVSSSPVFTLTKITDASEPTTQHLKEVSSQLFEFQKDLLSAREQAADGKPSDLRKLAESDAASKLPTYALRELVQAVKDGLHWAELQALIERLPEHALKEDSFFLEQQALAIGKQGQLNDSAALLETIIASEGATPERLGTLGSRYRTLAQGSRNRGIKRKYQAQAVSAFRRGMFLDLNSYYCSYKLMVMLTERDRSGDLEDARRCSEYVRVAIKRTREMGVSDEWLNGTEATTAFFDADVTTARRSIHAVLDQGWSNWKMVGLSADLSIILDKMPSRKRKVFQKIYLELDAFMPISQDVLKEKILPLLDAEERIYEKFQEVRARPAEEGERIISTTSSGEETINIAKRDDMVVQNQTEAREEYLVGRKKFKQRYAGLSRFDEQWILYKPLGEVRGLEIVPAIMSLLNVDTEFYIDAPWNERQFACEGDYLVSPYPDSDEVYRIGRPEFEQTYRTKESPNA